MRAEVAGRSDELAMLTACLDAAVAGRAALVLCRGEPGIGKTRLAEELVTRSAAGGVATAWGRADESPGVPPYWPWRQVLRGLGEHVDLLSIAAECRLTGDLGRLAPDLFRNAEGPGTVRPADETRFQSFEAVAVLLRTVVTRVRPVLIVLDDAQYAGRSSLLLLRHIARAMAGQRLLVLVNHRDTEPVPSVISELRREPVTRELPLRGLPETAVGGQLASLLEWSPSDDDVARVYARTGGNPFYVGELARVMRDPRSRTEDLAVPDGVLAAIATRLGRLGADTVRTLQAAAILGREVTAPLLAAVAELSVPSCLAALDEAAAARFLEPTAVMAESYRFVHDLVRDAVEMGLGSPERIQLHRRAAEVLEAADAGPSERRLAEVARHWAVAAVAGDRARAARWSQRAADEAIDRLAYEDAARLYRLAVTVGAQELDDEQRCRLLVAAAGALRLGGELSERLVTCREAVALARRLGRPDLLAEAALAMDGGEADHASERTLRRWCEEALVALDTGPSAFRARLLATLSDACMYMQDIEAAQATSGRALVAAERSGDAAALAAALRARQLVASGPRGLSERSLLAERMLALGRTTGDPMTRMWAHLWRIDVAFQWGDLGAVGRELDPLAGCVEESGSLVARWHLEQCRAVLAQAQGRFADAQRLADRALEGLPSSATGFASAVINRTGLLASVAVHTGEEPDLAAFRDPDRPSLPGSDQPGPVHEQVPTDGVVFAVATSFALASTGRLAEASVAYRRLGPPAEWRPIPHATTVCYAFGIATAIALGAADDVRVLRRLLLPFRGQHVVSGAGAVAYGGPVELHVGCASRHLGRLDEAVAELEAAARACRANGAAGFGVQASYELALALTRRGAPGDHARARVIVAQVRRKAGELGMRPWSERADVLSDRLEHERRDPLTAREREVAGLVAHGLTNRQIAARLHISERTAQNHVQHILTKLGLANRSQIAVRIVRESVPHGINEPPAP